MAAAEDYKPGSVPLEEQDDRRLFCKFHYKGVLLVLIPILLGPILAGHPVLACRFIYLTLCLYLIYILNLMARGAIAFLYVVFIPIAGIASSGKVSTSYYTDLLFLVFGAIFLGIMMDSSGLSERLAAWVIAIVGSSLKFLQIFLTLNVLWLAFLVNPTVAAAFWMKVSQAVITEYNNAGIVKMDSEEKPYEPGSKPYPTRPVIGIYLTCCYTASLAASFSPLMSPNGCIADALSKSLSIGTLALAMIGPGILGIAVMVFWFQFIFLGLLGGKVKRDLAELEGNKAGFKQAMNNRKEAMGPWTIYPILVFILILITFLLVATRKPYIVPGWADFNMKIESGSSVPTIGMAILFFAIPANYFFCRYYVCRKPTKEGTANSLLGWKAVNANTPWADIFMLGAAFSLVFCARESGFVSFAGVNIEDHGDSMAFLYGTFAGTVMGNLAPSTTICRIILPKLNAGDIFRLAFSTALHNQFLLPVSTPSNTIISGWGNIRPFQFLIAGSVISIIMFFMIGAFTLLLILN
ncbi:protein I'm not dead yet [Drosophila ficusphila]|uniref:protein I'm not dead yet n=1 Tax=Drosophila ficusphila TaxID=30025 RepID=UPI0007E64F4F|nr:protein I'm not dead yet [Drosophila ficusphila]